MDLPWIDPSRHVNGWPASDDNGHFDIGDFIYGMDSEDFGNLEFTDVYWEELREEVLEKV